MFAFKQRVILRTRVLVLVLPGCVVVAGYNLWAYVVYQVPGSRLSVYDRISFLVHVQNMHSGVCMCTWTAL